MAAKHAALELQAAKYNVGAFGGTQRQQTCGFFSMIGMFSSEAASEERTLAGASMPAKQNTVVYPYLGRQFADIPLLAIIPRRFNIRKANFLQLPATSKKAVSTREGLGLNEPALFAFVAIAPAASNAIKRLVEEFREEPPMTSLRLPIGPGGVVNRLAIMARDRDACKVYAKELERRCLPEGTEVPPAPDET